ncbi:hypothetical protein H0H87_003802 [Tephrocybe sp. NHM501043]|nr:hypothetical protein H0H87_003802 [Tephrocybe sp. NHM501043]
MSVSSRQRPSLTSPSSASVHHPASVRSTKTRRPPPPITTVITTPPWARDEPPSPKDRASPVDTTQPQELRPSDAASYTTHSEDPSSRWWTFTLPRTGRWQQPSLETSSPATVKPERKGIKDISISSWLPTSSVRDMTSFSRKDKEKDPEGGRVNDNEHIWDLSSAVPTSPAAQYTLAHTMTPGWDDPWSPRTAVQGPVRNNELDRESSYGMNAVDESEDSDKNGSKWRQRKKRLRIFMLSNIYVPLVRLSAPGLSEKSH